MHLFKRGDIGDRAYYRGYPQGAWQAMGQAAFIKMLVFFLPLGAIVALVGSFIGEGWKFHIFVEGYRCDKPFPCSWFFVFPYS
jgi:hypothetical protein